MVRGVDQLAEWLLRALMGEAVLLSLGAVAMVLCRQPARRVLIARAVLAGSLLMIPFLILDLGPRWRLGVFWSVDSASVVTLVPDAIRPWLAKLRANRAGFLCVYAGLFGAMSGWTLLGFWASNRLRSLSVPPGADVEAAYRAFAAPFGRVPELRVSERARGPMLLGALRPVIVIPPALDDPQRLEAARLSLLHELEHSQRGDLGAVLLASAVQSCWVVLPMVWWIRAQLLLDQEFLADRGASTRFGASGAYASSLVSLASDPVHAGVSPTASRGSRSALMLRVLMLVKSPFPVEACAPGCCRLVVPLVVVFAVWVASGAVRPESSDSPAGVPVRSAHRDFRLSRLVIEPGRVGSDGRSKPYRVMCPLPDSFQLSVEVWAAPGDLSAIEVAGVPLVACAEHVSETFHLVRIERRNGQCHVSVDGQPVEASPARSEARWLELRPAPGRAGRYRNLVVRW